MAMFCNLQDLKNESDVEQKLLWPLLRSGEGSTCPGHQTVGTLPL